MLSKVFLFVNNPDQQEEITKFVENLRRQKVDVQMISKELLNDSFDIFNAINKEQTLIISDNSLVCNYLSAKGYCVAAYIHDNNRHESFSIISYIIEGFEELDYEYLSHIYNRCMGRPQTILETDRCVLREITVEDVDSLYELYADPLVTQYIEPLYKDRERCPSKRGSYRGVKRDILCRNCNDNNISCGFLSNCVSAGGNRQTIQRVLFCNSWCCDNFKFCGSYIYPNDLK